MEPSNTSYFTRNYGWDEIEQNEDETERLRQLLSIWDAERIAILKLQHDLDKNVFQRKGVSEMRQMKHRFSLIQGHLIISNVSVKVLD